MKRALGTLLLLLTVFSDASLADSDEIRRLVLVTDSRSGIQSLTPAEVRRLFLGFPVTKDGHTLEAAINRSDPFLYQVFLQKIVYMSASVYERHLLSNVVQLGGQRPQSYTDTHALINALNEYPGTVSLLWDKQVEGHHLVILGEIWHGEAE